METYAKWNLKLHNYSSTAGGRDCATNHCGVAAVMTLAVGEWVRCSRVEKILKTVSNVEQMEGQMHWLHPQWEESGLLHAEWHLFKTDSSYRTMCGVI